MDNNQKRIVIDMSAHVPTIALRVHLQNLFMRIRTIEKNTLIVLDFKHVESISRSFAQQYILESRKITHDINEINLNDNVFMMLEIAKNPSKKKTFDFSKWEVVDFSQLT